MKLTVNGESHELFADPETPLLNILRNNLGLFGAKRGCAQEQCYSCAVLVDGRTQPSCQIPVSHVADLPITTVETLGELSEFFLAEQAGQCAFCISGMIVAAEGLLRQTRYPSDGQIREALDTNLCRCGVYDRVRRAIRFRIGDPEDPIWELREQAPLTEAPLPEVVVSLSTRDNPKLDSWIRIDASDTITVSTGKVELGQGIRTAIAHIAATQLGVDDARIVLGTADTAITPNEGVTAGSLSIQVGGEAMSAAAATARSVLVELASTRFGVPAEDLVIDDGTITDPSSGQQTTFWELQGGRQFDVDVDPWASRLGDDISSEGANTRIDLPAKVQGVPSYVHDLRDETTAHGRVLRPPSYEARLVELDSADAKAIAGVLSVVRNGSFVGVVAETEEAADAALEVLRASAKWDGTADMPTVSEDLLAMPLASYDVVDGTSVDHQVESSSRDQNGAFEVNATYSKPFTMHGSLGPSAAVGHFDGTDLTVSSSTQNAFAYAKPLPK